MESPWIPKDVDLRSLHFAFPFISMGGKCKRKGLEVKGTDVLLWDQNLGLCVSVCICACAQNHAYMHAYLKVILNFKFMPWAVLFSSHPFLPLKLCPDHCSCNDQPALCTKPWLLSCLISGSRPTHFIPFMKILLIIRLFFILRDRGWMGEAKRQGRSQKERRVTYGKENGYALICQDFVFGFASQRETSVTLRGEMRWVL